MSGQCAGQDWVRRLAAAYMALLLWLQKYHTAHGGDVEARKGQYADMVNKYYDLATSFYEYGELQLGAGCSPHAK